jgi:hypothetical protein
MAIGIALMTLAVAFSLSSKAYAAEPPVAAYAFDEGTGEVAEDIYGNHDGTIEHAAWAEGKYGTALQFHGYEEDNCVTVPDSPELQLTENFTLEAWIRPEGSLFGDTILFKEFEELGGGASYAFTVGYSAKGKVEGTIIEGEETVQTVTSPKALAEYTWAHIAFSFDGEKERLYVNGELVASHTASIGAIASSGPLDIGCAKGWESDYFWGKIDELRIYGRTLSEAEVNADKAKDMSPPKIELSGALTEGLKEGTTEYPLHVHATDGEVGRPGVGVKSITILVDGEVVDNVEQECPAGSCPLEREWSLSTVTLGFEPHRVLVQVSDVGGLEETAELELAVPNGSIPV